MWTCECGKVYRFQRWLEKHMLKFQHHHARYSDGTTLELSRLGDWPLWVHYGFLEAPGAHAYWSRDGILALKMETR